MTPSETHHRLPLWGHAIVLAGAMLTYILVGLTLHSPDFRNDLDAYLFSSDAPASFDAERVVPLFLLLIPAVLGGMGTRALLLRILQGLQRKESAQTIAIAIGGMLLSGVVLALVALVSSSRRH